jgi:hypothetical protein
MRAEDCGQGPLRAVPNRAPVVLALLAALLVLGTGCADGVEPTAVPTFPAPAEQAGPSAADDPEGALPDDCGRVLTTGDLEALLGLPLGTVSVRTIRGVPEPSVRRTERVSCDYTSGSARRPLLDIRVSAYADEAAATSQWKVNVAAESGEQHDVPLGSASAALFERRGETALLVAHGAMNLTAVLPEQPLPGGRSRGDVLVDLALRVLPVVTVSPAAAARAGQQPAAGAPPTGTVS